MSLSKYKNKKVSIGGHTFHSAKEGRRWQELVLLERSGQISSLRLQPRYKLIVEGKLVCSYIGDFAYLENGEEVTEDVKSEFTRKLPLYRVKAKLFEALMGRSIKEV